MVSMIYTKPTDNMPWIQTYTGKQFFPLQPRTADICIVDIAHALSNLCRFTGHCRHFYSVAQHAVEVSRQVPEKWALQALLHDASEAYLADIARPIKHSLAMEPYRNAERHLQGQIYHRFGLPATEPEVIKIADMRMLCTEKRDLLGPEPAEWDLNLEPYEGKIEPCSPNEAKALFLYRFYDLSLNLKELREQTIEACSEYMALFPQRQKLEDLPLFNQSTITH